MALRAEDKYITVVQYQWLVIEEKNTWFAKGERSTPEVMLVGSNEGAAAWVAVSGVDERPLWARYVRSFDRGLLIFMGEGGHGLLDNLRKDKQLLIQKTHYLLRSHKFI